MPLSFPLAADARAALDAELGARTIAEARELARGPVTLVSDWLRPESAEREAVQGKAEAGVSRGFVQLYEDARGQPVIAVTYWKPQSAETKAAAKTRAKPASDTINVETRPPAPVEDTTDDLYFARPSSRTKKRKRADDPNQLDLFNGPSQRGAETPDPGNPGVVIVDEEGDGASFGRAAQESPEDLG